MDDKLLSCPFCGSRRLALCRTNENACWVECADCWGKAPSAAEQVDAVRIWNTRHAPASAQFVEDDEAE